MDDPDKKKHPAAVYVAWGTFKNAIDRLAQAIPNRIDRTVYPGLNPAVVNQLLAGFKFLGLTDDAGKPTPRLQALAVSDETERKRQFAALIRERYADLFGLDLLKTTPAELNERMESSYGVKGDTREKAVRFFISSLDYAGIPASGLLKKTGGANGSTGLRKKRTFKPKASANEVSASISQRTDDSTGGGASRIITLKSGGTLTLSASINFLALKPSDRRFFSDLIDQLDKYEQEGEKQDD
jgi:Family of unknown function (DUF5343)